MSRPSARGRQVEIRYADTAVRKCYVSGVTEEYEKAQRLHALSRPGRFMFARPLALMQNESAIDYELVWPSIDLSGLLDKTGASALNVKSVFRVMVLCGEALAAIHCGLRGGSEFRWKPPPSFANALEHYGQDGSGGNIEAQFYAFGHGDFGFSNLLVTPSGPGALCLHVIDSSANTYTSQVAFSFEPVYVDVGLFISGLLGRVSLRAQRTMWQYGDQLMEAFLTSYERASSLRIDREILMAYACASVRSYRKSYDGRRGALPRRAVLRGLEYRISRQLQR